MSTWLIYVIIYGAVTVIIAGLSAVNYWEAYSKQDERTYARVFFLSPLWLPVGLGWCVLHGPGSCTTCSSPPCQTGRSTPWTTGH